MKPNKEGIWEWFKTNGDKVLVCVFDVSKKERVDYPSFPVWFRVYWWGSYYDVENDE